MRTLSSYPLKKSLVSSRGVVHAYCHRYVTNLVPSLPFLLGDIVTYKWFGDGYLMIGFAQGFLVVNSTKPSEIGSEIKRFHLFKEELADVSYR